MKAMILAAGKGTRVQPITFNTPKPMIPLIRKPVMESILEVLRDSGITDIMINTSHLAPVIEEYFGDGERFGVNIAYSFEGVIVDGELKGKALGSAGGMKKIQNFSGFFDETFVVLCGDAWIDLDLRAVYKLHKENGAIASIVLKDVPHDEVYKYGIVETDSDGKILQFQEKPDIHEAVSCLANTGIYMFEPEVMDFIPDGHEYDIGSQLFPKLVEAKMPFYGFEVPFQWIDIGSVDDLWRASRLVLNGEINGYKMPGREIRPGIWTGINTNIEWDRIEISGPVYIGSSTRIEAGAKITGPTVIGSNCYIQAGAILDQCLIDDYTRIGGIARLKEKIIYGSNCISLTGESLDVEKTDIGFIIDDARKELDMSEHHKLIFEFASELDHYK